MNPYLGHEDQISSILHFERMEGKAKGMEFLLLRNQAGMEVEVSLFRNADISCLRYKGSNLSFLSPCGYVGPSYYEKPGNGFLRSFTAGFLTTCGLKTFGSPSFDLGEELPLHGTISNTPASSFSFRKTEDELRVSSLTEDQEIFSDKLTLHREISLSREEPVLLLRDTVKNEGDRKTPLMILYHMNLGYPFLDEGLELDIPLENPRPRSEEAEIHMLSRLQMEKPQANFQERCYYYDAAKENHVRAFSKKLGIGMRISFSNATLPCFTEWKMMGIRDYVLGLEPGTNFPDGRKTVREQGKLRELAPGESITFSIRIDLTDERKTYDNWIKE